MTFASGNPTDFPVRATRAAARSTQARRVFTRYTPSATAADAATFTITMRPAAFRSPSPAPARRRRAQPAGVPDVAPVRHDHRRHDGRSQGHHRDQHRRRRRDRLAYPAARRQVREVGHARRHARQGHELHRRVPTRRRPSPPTTRPTRSLGGGASIPIALSGAGQCRSGQPIGVTGIARVRQRRVRPTSPTQRSPSPTPEARRLRASGSPTPMRPNSWSAATPAAATLTAGASCGFDVAYKPSAVGTTTPR